MNVIDMLLILKILHFMNEELPRKAGTRSRVDGNSSVTTSHVLLMGTDRICTAENILSLEDEH